MFHARNLTLATDYTRKELRALTAFTPNDWRQMNTFHLGQIVAGRRRSVSLLTSGGAVAMTPRVAEMCAALGAVG